MITTSQVIFKASPPAPPAVGVPKYLNGLPELLQPAPVPPEPPLLLILPRLIKFTVLVELMLPKVKAGVLVLEESIVTPEFTVHTIVVLSLSSQPAEIAAA